MTTNSVSSILETIRNTTTFIKTPEEITAEKQKLETERLEKIENAKPHRQIERNIKDAISKGKVTCTACKNRTNNKEIGDGDIADDVLDHDSISMLHEHGYSTETKSATNRLYDYGPEDYTQLYTQISAKADYSQVTIREPIIITGPEAYKIAIEKAMK